MDFGCCETCIVRSMCTIKDCDHAVRCGYFIDYNMEKAERMLLDQKNKNRKQKILNSELTRQELTPKKKLEDFLRELVAYLKTHLSQFTNRYGEIEWTCNQDHYYGDIKPFDMVSEFCDKKNLFDVEVLNLIYEYIEYDFQCECDLLNDDKIKKLVGE